MKRIILNGSGYCAVTEDGKLMEYIPEDPADQSGVILLGKIGRLMPGLNCAFVDIGRKKNGFLPLDEESGTFSGGKIRSGETLLLQVKKEETGENQKWDIAVIGHSEVISSGVSVAPGQMIPAV